MFTSVVTNGVGPYTYVNDYGMGYTTTSHSNVAYQTYITPGTYHPSVTVTDSQGHSGNAQCGLIVANDIPKPTLSANAGGPYFGYVNEILTLDASRSTGNITAYTWNFGDGTGAYSTTSPTIQYTYTKTGIYNVELQVIDGSGNTATAYTTATINGKNDDNSDEKIVPDKGILIQHLLIYGQDGEILRPNENMMTQITLKSEWTSKLKSVRIIVSIPELGLETRSSLFDMSVNSVHSESLALPLDGVKPGVYYVRISVDNDQGKDQVRRIKYREIIVKDSTGCQTNCQG
jgi:PKD repeat protein